MDGDGGCEPAIKNRHNYLPHQIYYSCAAEVSSPLRDQDHHMPSCFLHRPPLPKFCLYPFHHILPVFQFCNSVYVVFSASVSLPDPVVAVWVPFSSSGSVPSLSVSTVGSASSSAAFSAAASAFLAFSIHSLMFSYLIPEGPLGRLFLRIRTAQSISSSVGTDSSTWNGSTDRGVLSPGDCTLQYSLNHSTMIRVRVSQAGGVARLTTALL